jgi:DHA1 family tetracycline resistance protein-like MFS transporter
MMGPIMFTNVFAVAISASGPLHLPGAPYLLAGMLVMAALFVSAFTIRPALASAE